MADSRQEMHEQYGVLITEAAARDILTQREVVEMRVLLREMRDSLDEEVCNCLDCRIERRVLLARADVLLLEIERLKQERDEWHNAAAKAIEAAMQASAALNLEWPLITRLLVPNVTSAKPTATMQSMTRTTDEFLAESAKEPHE